MMYLDPYYPDTGDSGGGGTGGTGGTDDGGTTGGTDPTSPPTWKPEPNGWWEFIGGVWRWVTDPAPRTLEKTV
jgi:hypothetical protein